MTQEQIKEIIEKLQDDDMTVEIKNGIEVEFEGEETSTMITFTTMYLSWEDTDKYSVCGINRCDYDEIYITNEIYLTELELEEALENNFDNLEFEAHIW